MIKNNEKKKRRAEAIKNFLEGKPENFKKFFTWFWKEEKEQPFKYEELKLLLHRVKKAWPGKIRLLKNCAKDDALIGFTLKDLNLRIVIRIGYQFYFVDVDPGTGESYGSMRIYLKDHDEILNLIKKLHEHDITGKILRRYIPDPPKPGLKAIPSSLKGRDIKSIVKRVKRLLKKNEKGKKA